MWKLLGAWFFAREDGRTAAAVRIGFSAVYLLMLFDFHPAMHLLFGRRGLFGTMEPLPYALEGWRYLLFHYDAAWHLELWFALSALAAFSGLVGFYTRWSVAATLLSMLLFRERGPYITFGADLVLNCVGVLLLFADSGRAWSLDNLRHKGSPRSHAIEGWPVKAIQLQVALVYLVTGLVKIHTAPWLEGSAVYYALQVGNLLKGNPEFRYLHHHTLMAALNYGTLLTELAFPLLAFDRRTRWLALLAGVAMHSGIDLLMSIRFFSMTMYVGYLAFVRAEDWEFLVNVGRRIRHGVRTRIGRTAAKGARQVASHT